MNAAMKEKSNATDKDYYSNIRTFLQKFKTQLCKDSQCDIQNCFNYHSKLDLRRSPYFKYTIIYLPYLCQQYGCNQQICKNCHNMFELQYHPLIYLTVKCNKYNTCSKKYCPNYHQQDIINPNITYFFKFDLNTFKTKSCFNQCNHNLKICLYFHNKMDRRRPDFTYQHMSCQYRDNCPRGEQCKFSHNKIQQLYHPSRYKSKFCEKYPDKIQQCQYREFCSFAHKDDQIVITLIHEKSKEPDFYVNQYKTVWCPYTTKHDRNKCVYAHNFQDFRRNPKIYIYQKQVCPNWNMQETITSLEMGGCPKGMQCNKCHGWKQFQNYPNRSPHKVKARKGYTSNMIGADINYQKQQLKKKIQKNFKQKMIPQQTIKKIAPIQLDQNLNMMIGAPFFTNQMNYNNSINNKILKPKIRTGSQRTRQNTLVGGNRKQSEDIFEYKVEEINQKNKFFHSKLYNYNDDDELFNKNLQQKAIIFQKQNLFEKKNSSKSQVSNFNYSKQFIQYINNTKILEKLYQKNIRQIKLLNFTQTQILNLNYLTKQQRQILLTKIFSYKKKSQQIQIIYSLELQDIFKRKNSNMILQKLRIKKIREAELINLVKDQIQQFQFLQKDQKITLLDIIKQFNDNKQFSDILTMISTIHSNQAQ